MIGVDSAALKGEDKGQIEIIGDGMDTVALTTLLRKKVGYAEIVSVEAAEKKDDQEKQCTYQYGMPCYSYQVVATDPYNNTCSIMWDKYIHIHTETQLYINLRN